MREGVDNSGTDVWLPLEEYGGGRGGVGYVRLQMRIINNLKYESSWEYNSIHGEALWIGSCKPSQLTS